MNNHVTLQQVRKIDPDHEKITICFFSYLIFYSYSNWKSKDIHANLLTLVCLHRWYTSISFGRWLALFIVVSRNSYHWILTMSRTPSNCSARSPPRRLTSPVSCGPCVITIATTPWSWTSVVSMTSCFLSIQAAPQQHQVVRWVCWFCVSFRCQITNFSEIRDSV